LFIGEGGACIVKFVHRNLCQQYIGCRDEKTTRAPSFRGARAKTLRPRHSGTIGGVEPRQEGGSKVSNRIRHNQGAIVKLQNPESTVLNPDEVISVLDPGYFSYFRQEKSKRRRTVLSEDRIFSINVDFSHVDERPQISSNSKPLSPT
jgi:hypothetical protein